MKFLENGTRLQPPTSRYGWYEWYEWVVWVTRHLIAQIMRFILLHFALEHTPDLVHHQSNNHLNCISFTHLPHTRYMTHITRDGLRMALGMGWVMRWVRGMSGTTCHSTNNTNYPVAFGDAGLSIKQQCKSNCNILDSMCGSTYGSTYCRVNVLSHLKFVEKYIMYVI